MTDISPRTPENACRSRKLLAPLAIALAVVGGTAEAHAAGEVLQLTRSHAAGDFDGDGAVDHVFGYPSWNSGRGAVVTVSGLAGCGESHRAAA